MPKYSHDTDGRITVEYDEDDRKMWLKHIANRRDLIAEDERRIAELLRVYECRKAMRASPEYSFLPAPRYPDVEIHHHRAAVHHLRIEIEDLERKITLHFGQESTHDY